MIVDSLYSRKCLLFPLIRMLEVDNRSERLSLNVVSQEIF